MNKTKDKPNLNGTPAKPKEKRRSNEKRKEKSRDAARCRRSRETEIFTELGQVLPLQREEVEQLDKASIMRLSIAYLKVREMLNLFPNIDDIQEPPPLLSSDDDRIEELEMKPFDILNGPESYKYLTSALDGFLLILSGDGDVTFVSESIAEYLGISQIDLLGQQIWEYTHQCDHDELKEALNIRRGGNLIDDKGKENGSNASNVDGNDNKNGSNESNNVLTTAHRDLFLRLKCTLTSRGRSVNIKSASYKVIHLTGHMVANTTGERILIGVGRPLPHPSNIEIPLGSATFLTKHSLDMKFTYVDDKMLSLLGYEPEDLLGKSLYECHHGADSESLMTTFKSVLSKGQGETCRYRFLGKTGGYCWVVSQATIVYDKQKPQSVVCVNYAVSELENNNEIYSCAQLEASCKNKEIEKDESTEKNLQDVQQQKHHQPQSKYYPPQKLQNAINTQIKTCAGDVRLNAVKILCKQQTVENPQIVVKCSDTAGSYTKNVLPPQVIRNSGASILFKKQAEESSVSPVRRTLNACSISSSNLKTPTGLEKRPKSVTASVFTQVPINSELIATFNQQSLPSNNSANLASSSSVLASQQQLPNQSQPPAAPTKSVTASVLTPISALTSPISRSFLPNTFGKGLSRNPANSASNKNNNSSSTPRDMNSRYLMFSEESPELTMLKEEPDDLTHLAPSLDDSTQLFGEMLDSLILPDAYGTLLSDDINSLDSQQSNCNNSSKNNNNNNNHHIDPFINYRDESNDTSCSPHLLSPGSASKSPEMSSIPSLCSPNSLSQDDEFAFMTMNVEDDIDLTMRAPYIPMNEQEDLPLLTEDLMWSAFSEELSLHKEALQMESLKNNSNNAVSSNCNTLHTSSISNSGINNNNNNSNEHSNSHKNNISTAQDNSNNLNDNESSLAALLCGNGGVNALHQHQHQSHQSHEDNNSDSRNISSISEVNILENDCKRRKILSVRNDNFGSDLMDSIDDFGPVFNKNSSNVDCWTMNHLLELNDSNPSSPTTSLHHHNQQQNPEKQSIIINTAIPTTTIHVPLITIQNKNTNSKLNCHSILNSNAIVTSNSNNNTTVNNSTITNSSCNNNANSMRRLSATLVKGINVNISPNANNCNSSGKPIAMNIGAIINQQNNNNSSKRPSNIILTATESKRLRNSPVVDAPTSPQLLQQLMAPSPQRPASRSPYERVSNSGGTRWTNNIDGGGSCNGGNGRNNTNNSSNGSSSSQAQPSNSVLKNLLVSGCDDTFPLQTPDEETCLSRSLQSPPLPGFYGSPLMCNITAEHILCRRATNPLIGGESILPSPPIPMDSDADMDEGGDSARHALHINLGSVDSLVGSVFSPVGSESSCSDSGIECGATINRGSSIIAGLFRSKNQSDNSKGAPLPGALKMAPAAPPPKEKLLESNQDANGADDLDGEGTRKMSFSFLDDENPLCSPFLMDLCDDVYNMDEPLHSEYMEGSEMTRVLSDWSPTGTST